MIVRRIVLLLCGLALYVNPGCTIESDDLFPTDSSENEDDSSFGSDTDTDTDADIDVPPEDTDAPPEDTDEPPEDTDEPPEDTDVPPEDTDVPPEDTEDQSDSTCDDGMKNQDESDVDCGGDKCPSCSNQAECLYDDDCLSLNCDDGRCSSPSGTHEDIVMVIDVPGRNPGGSGWKDSYSVGDKCYCDTTYDHDIGTIKVDTPAGKRTVRQVCEALGDGPGSNGRPIYNDIQCGNGPANDAGDEDDCPGRVDIGKVGCGHIGPKWDLSVFE